MGHIILHLSNGEAGLVEEVPRMGARRWDQGKARQGKEGHGPRPPGWKGKKKKKGRLALWHTPYSPYFGTLARQWRGKKQDERQETAASACMSCVVGVCVCACVNKGPACSCVPRLARINAKKLQASKQMRVREKPTHCDRASDVDAISSKGTDTE